MNREVRFLCGFGRWVLCFVIVSLLNAFGFSSASASPQDLVWSDVTIGENTGSSFSLSRDGTFAYVGDADGVLHRFRASDGGAPVSRSLGGMIQSTPAVTPDGNVYVGTTDGQFYALDKALNIRWQQSVIGEVTTSPAITQNLDVFVGTSDGFIYGFSPDGTQIWVKELQGYVGASPAVGIDGTLLYGTSNGALIGVNPETGQTDFTYYTGSPKGVGSVAVADNGNIYFGSYDNALIALDSEGQFKWRFQTTGRVASAPVIDDDGRIYFSDYDSHRVIALQDEGSGASLLWDYETEGEIYATPAIDANQTVYVGDFKGHFYALSGSDSDHLVWQVSGNSAYAASPAILKNGRILSVDISGKVKAFAGQGAGAAGQWPMFSFDGQRTGNKYNPDGDDLFGLDDDDTDNDSIPDAYELENGLDFSQNDAEDDQDGDLYSNIYEYNKGTDPSENEFDDRMLEVLKAYTYADGVYSDPDMELVRGMKQVAVSPTGEYLAVVAQLGYRIYQRSPEHGLTELQAVDSVGYPSYSYKSAVFSPDGQDLYLMGSTGYSSPGAVLHWRLEGDTWVAQAELPVSPSIDDGTPAIGGGSTPVSMAFSPDGHNLYVGASGSGITVFGRDEATGTLSFAQQFHGDGQPSFSSHSQLDMALDGGTIRFISSDFASIHVLDRDATTGLLSLRESLEPTFPSSSQNVRGTLPAPGEGWLNGYASYGSGGIDWRNADGTLRQRFDDLPIDHIDAVNLERSLVYVEVNDTLAVYHLDETDGLTLLDELTVEDLPALGEVADITVAPTGDRLYLITGGNGDRSLLILEPGYKGTGRPDRDGDGVEDILDELPDNPDEWLDTDKNGTGNNEDKDDDGDGCFDVDDDLPLNPDECLDTDGDGIGNVASDDDDGDGYKDSVDAFPLDKTEWANYDHDELGDNIDTDDDNDGISDVYEEANGLDPFDASDAGLNPDGDGLTNLDEYKNDSDPNQADTDGDGYADQDDQMPRDPEEHIDTDDDGIGNNADDDDDGDGLPDTCEATYGFDPLVASPDGQNTDGAGEPEGLKLTDAEECQLGSDPTQIDGDNDGMPDFWELAYGLKPLEDDANADLDGDLYWNLLEYTQGTDPSENEFDDRMLEVLKAYTYADGVYSDPAMELVRGMKQVAVSPTGEYVAVAAGLGYRIYQRAPEHGLTELQAVDSVGYPSYSYKSAVFSPDGQDLYLTGSTGYSSPGAVLHWRLEGDTWVEQAELPVSPSPDDGTPAIGGSSATVKMVLSPDGHNLYVGAASSGIAVFGRDETTGALSFAQQFYGSGAPYFSAYRDLEVARDGKTVRYVSSDFASIHVLDRDAATGLLSLRESLEPTFPSSSQNVRGTLPAPGEGWLNGYAYYGSGGIDWRNADGTLRQRFDGLAIDSIQAVNLERSLVYVEVNDTLAVYHLDETDGLTLLDELSASELPALAEMKDITVAPTGDRLYLITGGNGDRSLLILEPGYKGIGHPDSDGDGYKNIDDAFPNNPNEWTDADGDGYGDNRDRFDDDPTEWDDFDNDGRGDNSDPDIDGDHCLNDEDDLDFDSSECLDTDGDGKGNNKDEDDDGDKLPDVWESANGLNPLDEHDATLDLDGDGLTNEDEYHFYGTSANNADSDSDGINDGWEVQYGLDPADSYDGSIDSDGDGFSNVDEFVADTDPSNSRWYPGAPGLEKWVAETDGAVRTKPLVDANGTTYVGADDGKLYAFDVDGNPLWQSDLGSRIRSSPAMGADGSIYVGTQAGEFYKVDPASPFEPTLISTAGGPISTSPAISSYGAIYYGSDDGNVYAIDSDGNELWVYDTGSPVRSSPTVTPDGIVRIGSDDGTVYAIYARTGAPVE